MRRVVFVIGTILLLSAGGLAYALTRDTGNAANDQTSGQRSTPKETNSDATPRSDSTTPASGSSYIEYSQTAFEQAEGTRVLFFHASWCPQCRALDADLQSKGAPDGYTILKVDYDSNQDLRQKYGVTIQTTLIKVDGNGNKTGLYVAYDDPSVEALTRDFL